jgi:hypothetical protein
LGFCFFSADTLTNFDLEHSVGHGSFLGVFVPFKRLRPLLDLTDPTDERLSTDDHDDLDADLARPFSLSLSLVLTNVAFGVSWLAKEVMLSCF